MKYEHITKCINTLIDSSGLPDFEVGTLLAKADKLKRINKWLKDNGKSEAEAKEIIT